MPEIDQEGDIEVLRRLTRQLFAENVRLGAEVLRLTKALLSAEGKTKADLARKLADLQAKLARAQKALFGASSEKRDGEATDPAPGNAPGDPSAPSPSPSTKPKPKGHGPSAQPKLPVEEVPHDVDEPDKRCTQCGSPLTEWVNGDEISEEIDVLRRQFLLLRHRLKKYVCACGGCVETAIGPEKLFPGARYSIAVAAEIAVLKYLDHMPLERIARAWGRDGLVVTSQTLWDYLERTAQLVKPVYERLQTYVLAQPIVGADETHWRVMAGRGGKGTSKTWWVWALTTPKAVVYRLDPTRSEKAAEKLLAGYEGVVVCDGYAAYTSLRAAHAAITLAHCWAHARRAFLDIETAFPLEVAEVTGLIKKLYVAEKDVPRGPEGDAERRRVRGAVSVDVVGEIFGWVVKTLPEQTPGNSLAAAIRYLAGIWEGLLRFLDNPAVPLDNNASERSMRGPVVGRKNHYGSRSVRGTEVAAQLYSITESAKLAGIDPAAYLDAAIRAGLRGETIPLPHEWAPGPKPD